MPSKSILAHHVVFGAYGFWLPNDPRGSFSTQVWADHLKPFGSVVKVDTSQSVAKTKHDFINRQRAKRALKYPAVKFSDLQRDEIARGFAIAVQRLCVIVLAAAIMPDHVHLVVASSEDSIADIGGGFKRFASRALLAANCHPLSQFRDSSGRVPSPWCGELWKVFLYSDDEVHRAIEYVRQNPVEANLPEQHWPFVTTRF